MKDYLNGKLVWDTFNCQLFGDYHDPLKPITHLVYLDANNGWDMSQFLPTYGFRWLTQAEINYIIIKHLADDFEDGYIFEVDLTYPESLHPRHSDYPLAPERLTIDESMLSSLQQHIKRKIPPN